MGAEAEQRFDEFCEAARAGSMRAITHGGVAMRLRVAAVVLSIVAGLPGVSIAQEQSNLLQYAAAFSPSTGPALRAVMAEAPIDAARQALSALMSVRCNPVAMAATVADRNLECRLGRGIGQESSIDLLPDAEMVGQVLGVPVFLSPSDRVFVRHMISREGKTREWTPMLIMSRGLVNSLSNLSEVERNAGLAFLIAKERAIADGASSEAADFEGFQHATLVCVDVDKAQAGVESALDADASRLKGVAGASLQGRKAFLLRQFDVAREMRASILADVSERRR